MKASTVAIFTRIHTWTGLAAGMALFIAFYAGAMTVFFHELEVWDEYSAVAPLEQDYVQAQELVDQVLEVDPAAAETFRLYPSSPDHPGNVVRWFERGEDGTFDTHEYRMAPNGTLNAEADNAHLASFIYVLHYSAGLPARLGLYALGIVCMIYGLALLSGIIVFLPNFLKDLFVIRDGERNKKRFWLDTHNVVGVISLPWHFMFAWSSVILAIGIFFLAPFQYLVFDDDLIEMFGAELGVVEAAEPSGERAPMIDVAEIMHIAQREIPGFEASQLRYSHAGDSNGQIRVFGKVEDGSLSSNANITMATLDGRVINVSTPQSASLATTFYNGLIALHFVTFGGYTAKWVYFFLGLAGAFLFYSGNLLWVEARRKRRSPEQPKTGRFLARLNSGVCIGCMAGISAAFLMSRGMSEHANRADLTELAYYAVFFAAIAWSYLRSVADGARDLLYLCAALTAAIPVFDAVIIDMPVWRSIPAGEWAIFTVDCLAIFGAVAFWMMGRAVAVRARTGAPNSVWSNPKPDPAVGLDVGIGSTTR
ncbi:MAG: PepSY-associated TM helix domain-containing protein [Pseudomonadota bacterium]